MATQTLALDGWQPTALNRLLRMDRHDRQRALHVDSEVIGAEARNQRLAKATGRRRVSLVILCRGDVAVDPDAYFKTVLDALKKCGQLLDDNRHWLELGPVTYEEAKRRGLLIVLEDLDD